MHEDMRKNKLHTKVYKQFRIGKGSNITKVTVTEMNAYISITMLKVNSFYSSTVRHRLTD